MRTLLGVLTTALTSLICAAGSAQTFDPGAAELMAKATEQAMRMWLNHYAQAQAAQPFAEPASLNPQPRLSLDAPLAAFHAQLSRVDQNRAVLCMQPLRTLQAAQEFGLKAAAARLGANVVPACESGSEGPALVKEIDRRKVLLQPARLGPMSFTGSSRLSIRQSTPAVITLINPSVMPLLLADS